MPAAHGEQENPGQDAVSHPIGRGYAGVRITPPPRPIGPEPEIRPVEFMDEGARARILTGAALFGVIVVVLVHEFGHWLAGLAATGEVPTFLVVAVEQKTSDISDIAGVAIWGAGPALQLLLLWASTLFIQRNWKTVPRLFTAVGGAAIFVAVVTVFSWMSATVTGTNSWNDDIPKVATFLGTATRAWMHLLSLLYLAAVVMLGQRLIHAARLSGQPNLYIAPAIIGAGQGLVLVLIASFIVSFVTR